MKHEHLQEIIDCLPRDRTRFQYFRDRYSTLLLPWLVEDGTPLSDVKKSRCASLLNKAPAKEALKRCGNGMFDAAACKHVWAEPHECFLLTLDKWNGQSGTGFQVSRRGYNLVLQLNMNTQYLELFNKLVSEDDQWWFGNTWHPILQNRNDGFYRQTLGWARIDLDLSTGEALIEEIQSDWIKDVRWCKNRYAQRDKTAADTKKLTDYCDTVLDRLAPIWDEALLSASIWFLRQELGIRTIWYHRHESGSKLKKIRYAHPPRSLYTTLPKRFCFEQTDEHPAFMLQAPSFKRHIKRNKGTAWQVLRLN